MLLSEDHLAVQDAVRTYVQAEIAPHAAAWDKSHAFPKDALVGLAALDGSLLVGGALAIAGVVLANQLRSA